MSPSKIRIYTVLSEPFRYGFLMMARTLAARNPNLEVDLRVLYNPELSPLSEKTREWLSVRVPNARFISVDLGDYENVFRLRDEVFKTPPRLWAAFLILEAFRDGDPDVHVLCLDSDLICMAPLGADVLRDTGFAAVEARTDDGRPMGFFNTGVMAIGKDHRGDEPFRRIMALRDTNEYDPSVGKADQALLSLFYTPENADQLDWRYNVTKRHTPATGVGEFLNQKDTVFFHFVGSKPWHVSLDTRDITDHEVVDIWDAVVEEHLEPEEMIGYLKAFRDTSRNMTRNHASAKVAKGAQVPPLLHKIARRVRRVVRRGENALGRIITSVR